MKKSFSSFADITCLFCYLFTLCVKSIFFFHRQNKVEARLVCERSFTILLYNRNAEALQEIHNVKHWCVFIYSVFVFFLFLPLISSPREEEDQKYHGLCSSRRFIIVFLSRCF